MLQKGREDYEQESTESRNTEYIQLHNDYHSDGHCVLSVCSPIQQCLFSLRLCQPGNRLHAWSLSFLLSPRFNGLPRVGIVGG